MEDQEQCPAWIRSGVPHTETVSCSVLSRDGEGYLRVDLMLQRGRALVTVLDATGETIYEEYHSSVEGVSSRIEGAKGEWTLRVAFEGAQGTGNIHLWG
jgi:hypothetical protein